jgi:hypothetical protein
VYADVNGTVYNETLYMFCNIYDDDILLKTWSVYQKMMIPRREAGLRTRQRVNESKTFNSRFNLCNGLFIDIFKLTTRRLQLAEEVEVCNKIVHTNFFFYFYFVYYEQEIIGL